MLLPGARSPIASTPNPLQPTTVTSTSDETKGLWLGLLGVVIFSLTMPMTRMAVGGADGPQLSAAFVTAGRAGLAALLAAAYLLVSNAGRPCREHVPAMVVSGLGTVVGFPLLLALALERVDAVHASVITGVLPLATAVVAAIVFRQKPSWGFWACALLGCALVLTFAVIQGGGAVTGADGLLFAAMACAACGYVAGVRLSQKMPAELVICWILVGSCPLTLPATYLLWPLHPVNVSSWVGFAYVTVFSMWLGFFAWYRGLALGGAVRVSQVQLLQPFLGMMFAVPILGEELDLSTVVFSVAVVAVVFLGRRMPTQRGPRPTPSPRGSART
jgi:drug/metabolite transporter (DMT)-like permease